MEHASNEGRQERTFSLQLIFALSVMTLITVLTGTAAKIILDREKVFLEAETERRLLAQCRSLASLSAAPLLDEFPEFVLTPLIKDILSENSEIAYAVVVDPNGKIRGADDLRDVETDYKKRAGLTPREVTLAHSDGETFHHDDEVMEVSVPIRYSDGSVLGSVYLGMRKSHVNSVIDEARHSTIKVMSVAALVGILFSYILVSRIVSPINLLTKGSEAIGRGNLDYKIHVKSRTEIGRLARQFNEMTTRLKGAQEELVEQERLGKEIEIAQEIEERLLPRPNLAIQGYDAYGFHQSAQKVGGDYYDVIPLDDEHVGITVADVSGKGIPGLVVMAMTSALLRTHGPRFDTPSETLIALNRMLCPSMRRGTFITMFYGILHLQSGTLRFSGAGHNPLIHFNAKSGLQSLMRTTGVPLGIFAGKRFDDRVEDQTIVLGPGDGIVQYTDGVNEATNENLQEFGMDSLLDVIRNGYDRNSQDLIESVVERIRQFTDGMTQSDDITLLVLKRASTTADEKTSVRVMA